MQRPRVALLAVFVASALAWTVHAQTARSIPRPPAQQPGAPPAGSAAHDGYSPVPQWVGQTHAPRVSVSVPYATEVVSTGIANGYSIEFMPDGRILLVERPGRLKIIDRSGQISAPVAGLPPIYAGGPQGLVGAIADREFATNHIIYLAYTAADPNVSAPAVPSKVEGPPASSKAEGPAPIKVEGPAPIKVEGPAPSRVEGPAPIKVEGPAPSKAEGPVPSKVEGPVPSKVEGPPRLAGVLTIARARLSADSGRLEDVRVILNAEGIGGRMIQARDGTLLIASSIPAGVGILSEDWPQPQQLDSLMGKVLRINGDGTVPRDNPFVGRPNARPEIFALGIRDDQGLAFHPRTGRLWASEHGPRGGDEINVIDKGKNYGFPVIGYGHDYNGQTINGDRTSQAGMEQPAYFWTPDIAPGGISFYNGKLFPAWQGDLFVAALAGKHLARLVLQGERVIGEERLLTELDTRIRDVREGPDGALYVLTDRDGGKLLRLVPPREPSAKGSR